MDIVYVGVTLIFFALSWGLIALCERLETVEDITVMVGMLELGS